MKNSISKDPRSWKDHEGVVHRAPENWAVHNYLALCGLEIPAIGGAFFSFAPTTCIRCAWVRSVRIYP